MTEFVRVQTEGAVGTIRLDRPPMNALNIQLQEELRAAGMYSSVAYSRTIREACSRGASVPSVCLIISSHRRGSPSASRS